MEEILGENGNGLANETREFMGGGRGLRGQSGGGMGDGRGW